MAIEITKIMFKYEKRMKMRETKTYKVLKEIWDGSELSLKHNIGDCDYLIRQYFDAQEDKTTMIDRKTWAQYYLKTGENRKKAQENKKQYFDFEKNKYYGRTMEDLLSFSKKLIQLAQEKNVNIDIAGALNFVYCVIIDEIHIKYTTIFKEMKNLKKKNEDLTFILSDPYAYTNQDIDIFALDGEGKLRNGFRLVDSNYESNEMTEQKDSIFENIYNCNVELITTDKNFNFKSDDFSSVM